MSESEFLAAFDELLEECRADGLAGELAVVTVAARQGRIVVDPETGELKVKDEP